MQHTGIRWLIFIGLAAFVPLIYYLAVVGGLLPYGGILLIGLRHLTDFGIAHGRIQWTSAYDLYSSDRLR